MRFAAIAVIPLVATGLTAATTYRVRITSSEPPATRREATVIVEGRNRRITFADEEANPIPFDVLLSDDGGATTIALNTTLKTWFEGPRGLGPAPRIYRLPMSQRDTAVRNIVVTIAEEPESERLEGLPTRKFVGRIAYDLTGRIHNEPLEASVSSTILLWTTSKLDAALAFHAAPLSTGVAAVDAELQPKLDAIPGFPLKIEVSATRVIKGGPPLTQLFTATVSHIGRARASAEMFKRPAGYIYQKPIVFGPGVVQH